MLTTLAVPLAMATLFTAGAFGIRMAERHADRITVALGALAAALTLLVLAGVATRLSDRDRPTAAASSAGTQVRPLTAMGHGRPPAHVPVN